MTRTYHVEYDAWPEGARIKSHGEFDIAAASAEDARKACAVRWPEMNILRITLKDTSNGQ